MIVVWKLSVYKVPKMSRLDWEEKMMKGNDVKEIK